MNDHTQPLTLDEVADYIDRTLLEPQQVHDQDVRLPYLDVIMWLMDLEYVNESYGRLTGEKRFNFFEADEEHAFGVGMAVGAMVQQAIEHGEELTGSDYARRLLRANDWMFAPRVDPEQPVRLTATRSRLNHHAVKDPQVSSG